MTARAEIAANDAECFDPRSKRYEPEWDDMVRVWDLARAGADIPGEIRGAVAAMLTRQEQFQARLESDLNQSHSGDRERYQEWTGNAWTIEAKATAALVRWARGEKDGCHVVKCFDACVTVYESLPRGLAEARA